MPAVLRAFEALIGEVESCPCLTSLRRSRPTKELTFPGSVLVLVSGSEDPHDVFANSIGPMTLSRTAQEDPDH